MPAVPFCITKYLWYRLNNQNKHSFPTAPVSPIELSHHFGSFLYDRIRGAPAVLSAGAAPSFASLDFSNAEEWAKDFRSNFECVS